MNEYKQNDIDKYPYSVYSSDNSADLNDYEYINDASSYIELNEPYTLKDSKIIKWGKLVQLFISLANDTAASGNGIKVIGNVKNPFKPKNFANNGFIGGAGNVTGQITENGEITFRIGTSIVQSTPINLSFVYFV